MHQQKVAVIQHEISALQLATLYVVRTTVASVANIHVFLAITTSVAYV